MASRFVEYAAHDALELARRIRAREVSAAEVLEACIERIEHLNPRFNAVIDRLYDRARSQVTAGLPEGPLAGVPILLKDLLAMLAGTPMRSGSRLYGDWAPAESSEEVRRYLAGGLVIVGKTNTPELGLVPTTEPERFGPTRNPWNPERTTGGSSGGSAAAVAARMVPAASGGDGGGSIRIPAACCGVFGLKPSRGRTPVGPQVAEVWRGFNVNHVLTRSVRDSAAFLDLIAGACLGDSYALPRPTRPFLDALAEPPRKLRIAWSHAPLLPTDGVAPECRAAVEETARLLSELGHELCEGGPTIDGAAFARDFLVILGGHTWAAVRVAEQRVGRRATAEDLEEKTRLAAKLGAAFSAGEYVQAVDALLAAGRDVLRFCEGYDLLLTPAVARPAPPLGFLRTHGMQAVMEKIALGLPIGALLKGGKTMEQAAAEAFAFIPWTPVLNVTGQPSASLPLGWSADGLPVGVMLTGRVGDEATLLRTCAELEAARPWGDRIPPGCA